MKDWMPFAIITFTALVLLTCSLVKVGTAEEQDRELIRMLVANQKEEADAIELMRRNGR